MTATTKRQRETKALAELRQNHSYLMYQLRQKAERDTTIFTHKRTRGGRDVSTLAPAVAIKLVVPAASVLGREVIASCKIAARKKRLSKRGRR